MTLRSPPVRRTVPVAARRGALLCLVLVLAVAGCTETEDAGEKGYVTGNGSVVEVAPAERGEPVDLTGETLAGGQLDLASLRGKPVVVSVWGSWCAPCRAEADDVNAVARGLGDRAHVVGINIRDPSRAQARAYVRRYDVPFPSYYSPDGQELLAFQGTLTPRTIPSFVVLDAQGRIAGSIIGRLPSRGTLMTLAEDVVAETAGDRGPDAAREGERRG